MKPILRSDLEVGEFIQKASYLKMNTINGPSIICELKLKDGSTLYGDPVADFTPYGTGFQSQDYALKEAIKKLKQEYGPQDEPPEETFIEAGEVGFDAALVHLKKGGSCARTGWNGKDLYIQMQKPDAHSQNTLPYLYIVYPDNHPKYPAARVPWLASQTDMMEEDWMLMPHRERGASAL